jgi:hypothetical protein
MVVEGFWKSFKHGALAAFSKPRLDFLIHLILTTSIRSINEKLNWMNYDLKNPNMKQIGWPKPLAPCQKDFKQAWELHSRPDKLNQMNKELALLKSVPKNARERQKRQQLIDWAREEAQRPPGSYFTSLEQWTCSCPSYLVSHFLLCKHLVREANSMLKTRKHGLDFFKYIRRHHTAPFYRLPGIHPNPDIRPQVQLLTVSSTRPTDHGNDTDDDLESDASDSDDSASELPPSEAPGDSESDNDDMPLNQHPTASRIGRDDNGNNLVFRLSSPASGSWSDSWDGSCFVDPSSDGLGLGDDLQPSPALDGNGKVSRYFSSLYLLH